MQIKSKQLTMEQIRFQEGFKRTLSYLWDDVPATIFYLQQIQTYKRWKDIFNWLVDNEIKGNKLVDLFKNETDTEKGSLVAFTFIINRMEGTKGFLRPLNKGDLL